MRITSVILLALLCFVGTLHSETLNDDLLENKDIAGYPKIVSKLPSTINGYKYSDFTDYGDGLGYSLRFIRINENKNYADIYIWDKPKEASEMSHRDVVYAVTNMAVKDIESNVDSGSYSKINYLERLVYGDENNLLTLHKISMQKGNMLVLSFLYVSEYQGNLLKIRVTILDNEFNRERQDIHDFAIEALNVITAQL